MIPKALRNTLIVLVVLMAATIAWRKLRVQPGTASPTTITATPAIASVNGYVVALSADGFVYTWGQEDGGRLGRGTTSGGISAPKRVEGVKDAKAIAAFANYAMALLPDGTVMAWGRPKGGTGPLKWDGTAHEHVKVPGAISLVAASAVSMALKDDGTVWGWGTNGFGELGAETKGEHHQQPILVKGLADIKRLVGANHVFLALAGDGTLYAWGDNRDGRLGVASTPSAPGEGRYRDDYLMTPLPVEGLPTVTQVAVSTTGTSLMALGKDGRVWTWGENLNACCDVQAPRVVEGLDPARAIGHGGASGGVALLVDGTLWQWGMIPTDDRRGRMAERPEMVSWAGGVSAVFAGGTTSFAITREGSVIAWGDGSKGELGTGDARSSATPVELASPILGTGR